MKDECNLCFDEGNACACEHTGTHAVILAKVMAYKTTLHGYKMGLTLIPNRFIGNGTCGLLLSRKQHTSRS